MSVHDHSRAAAILFLMDSYQKLIRSSEIRREEPYQNLEEIQPMVHKLLCPQAFWAAILENGCFWLCDIGHIDEKNKQNLSVNFLVRAKLRIRPRRRRRGNAHYIHPDILPN